MVAQSSKGTKRQREKVYAKGRIEGKSQRQSYLGAFSSASPTTAGSKACLLEKRPAVQQMITLGIEKIREKDADDIVKGVVREAKQTKKTVFVGKLGEKHTINDNMATIASRDQFFKLVGHPSFTTGVQITHNKLDVYIGKADAEAVTASMRELIAMKSQLDSDDTDSDSLIVPNASALSDETNAENLIAPDGEPPVPDEDANIINVEAQTLDET